MNLESLHNASDWITFLKIECQSKKQALQIEKQIKNMKSKVYIQNLKRYPEMTIKLLENIRTVNQNR
jgi:putative endonuclease